jgi:hypothetical protein
MSSSNLKILIAKIITCYILWRSVSRLVTAPRTMLMLVRVSVVMSAPVLMVMPIGLQALLFLLFNLGLPFLLLTPGALAPETVYLPQLLSPL